MKTDLSHLATAFNDAVRKRSEESRTAASGAASLRRELEAEREARLEAAREARKELVNALAGFAGQIDAVRVERKGDGLVLGAGEHAIALQATDDGLAIGGVGDQGDGITQDVDGHWIITLFGATEPLLPDGLARLLVAGLDLPAPHDLADPPPPVIRRKPKLNAGIMPPRPPYERS